MTHWSLKQEESFQKALEDGATLAYWCSDSWGRPCNGGKGSPASPGHREKTEGGELCGEGCLHATLDPHKWKGQRIWVVALRGDVKKDDNKFGSLDREIIGEILPEESLFDPKVAIRLGNLTDLYGANLSGANLSGANLSGANLYGAYYPTGDVPSGWVRNSDGYLAMS